MSQHLQNCPVPSQWEHLLPNNHRDRQDWLTEGGLVSICVCVHNALLWAAHVQLLETHVVDYDFTTGNTSVLN